MVIENSIYNLLELSQEVICMLSLKGEFLKSNKSFCQKFGYTSDDLVGECIEDYLHPEEKEKHLHFFRNFKDKISPYHELEHRFLDNDGNYKWMSWTFTIVEPHLIFALGRDITKQKEEHGYLLKKLSENVDYYNALLQNLPQIIWTADPKGDLDFYNQYALDYTGMAFGCATSWTWFSLIHPEDRGKTLNSWTNSIASGEPYHTEFRLKRNLCGHYRWVQAKAHPYKDNKGKITKWFGLCTDIHDYKQLQKEVKSAKLQLKKIFVNASLYIWGVDKKGIINFSQGILPKSLKPKTGKICGKNSFSVFKDFPEIQRGIKSAIDGDENTDQLTIAGSNYEFCSKPLQNNYGENLGMIGVIQPRTQRRNALHDNTNIYDMINNELRSPLHTIISFSEILEKKIVDDDHKKYLKYIISSGDTMKNFLMNIYTLDENTSGMEIERKDFLC